MNEQDIQKKTESDIEEFINKTKVSLEKRNMSTKDGEAIGIVEKVFDGIVYVSGLYNVGMSEMVNFEKGEIGFVFNLESYFVGITVLGSIDAIKAGDIVKRTHAILSIPVGPLVIGRVLDPLSNPLDGGANIPSTLKYPVERKAAGVMSRKSVSVPLETGIIAIDALIPIGRGQRELIIGDRQTGKTSIAIDTILNQKGKNITCVYVSIGQKDSKIKYIEQILKKNGAMEYTVIVHAGASSPASMQYIAPYSGSSIAEFFMDKGEDVLIVYDDLSKHAVAYRELSLLMKRPPGREAYPGDVFYIHSRLLERSCRLDPSVGGGSITALPIIETQANDVSAYIPTNVISITDGQIFLESNLFNKGVLPAVNVGLSVSRVGGSAQRKAMKKVAGTLKLELAQFRELEVFSQFGSELDDGTQAILKKGKIAVELLKQDEKKPLLASDQIILLTAYTKGLLNDTPLAEMGAMSEKLIELVNRVVPEFGESIMTSNMWIEEDLNRVVKVIKDFLSL